MAAQKVALKVGLMAYSMAVMMVAQMVVPREFQMADMMVGWWDYKLVVWWA